MNVIVVRYVFGRDDGESLTVADMNDLVEAVVELAEARDLTVSGVASVVDEEEADV